MRRMSLISARAVSLNYGAASVLQGVDLTIIVTVIGPNGSGKSTLSRALTGAKAPAEGAITRKGACALAMCRSAWRLMRICR